MRLGINHPRKALSERDIRLRLTTCRCRQLRAALERKRSRREICGRNLMKDSAKHPFKLPLLIYAALVENDRSCIEPEICPRVS